MPSSTSNSEHGTSRDSLSPVWALALLIGLAGVLTLVTGRWRPDLRNPVGNQSFFRMKLAWRNEADVVVLGNSQVYRGVDPQAFAEGCNGAKTLNFGFSGALLRPSYVAASLSVLRADGPKVLLVGINPLEFKSEQISDGFIDSQRHHAQFRLPWQFEAAMQPMLQRLRPLEKPLPAARLVSWDYRPDGFVASDSPAMAIKPERYARYAHSYVRHPFSELMYQGLLDQLQSLQGRGYRVLVYSTYSSPAFMQIDARMSGLDDDRLARDLRGHGLTYLPVATQGQRSYDGTHLDAASAAVFSRRLGEAVSALPGDRLCSPEQVP